MFSVECSSSEMKHLCLNCCVHRNNLHQTIRIVMPHLLFLFADSGFLKPIDEAHLECFIKDHPSLLEVMHLLPENLFVSGWEDIPGLKPSPTGKL